MFFIEDGEVSVLLQLSNGAHQRIATLSPGMSFGEMVMLGQAARSASVHADTSVHAWTLTACALDELALEHPEIKIAVLKNLSLDLAQKLRQANQLISALAKPKLLRDRVSHFRPRVRSATNVSRTALPRSAHRDGKRSIPDSSQGPSERSTRSPQAILTQKRLGSPACLRTALAVCLDLMLLSTGNRRPVCGENQIS